MKLRHIAGNLTVRIGGKRGQVVIGGDHLAEVIDVVEFIQRHQLDTDVAERRRFNRPRHDANTAGIGAQLVQQGVLAATTDNVQLAERFAAQCRQFLQDIGVQQCEAVENTARQFRVAIRHRLSDSRQAA